MHAKHISLPQHIRPATEVTVVGKESSICNGGNCRWNDAFKCAFGLMTLFHPPMSLLLAAILSPKNCLLLLFPSESLVYLYAGNEEGEYYSPLGLLWSIQKSLFGSQETCVHQDLTEQISPHQVVIFPTGVKVLAIYVPSFYLLLCWAS